MATGKVKFFNTEKGYGAAGPCERGLDRLGGGGITVLFRFLHLAGQATCDGQSYGGMIARVGHLILRITKGGTVFALPTSAAPFWNSSTGHGFAVAHMFLAIHCFAMTPRGACAAPLGLLKRQRTTSACRRNRPRTCPQHERRRILSLCPSWCPFFCALSN
jgi:hypothetical protein